MDRKYKMIDILLDNFGLDDTQDVTKKLLMIFQNTNGI